MSPWASAVRGFVAGGLARSRLSGLPSQVPMNRGQSPGVQGKDDQPHPKGRPPEEPIVYADNHNLMRIVWKLLVALFLAEALLMLIFPLLPPMSPWVEVLVDATTLCALALLPIWRWVVRPLKRSAIAMQNLAAELQRAKDELELANAVLEQRVDDGAAELKGSLAETKKNVVMLSQSRGLLRLEQAEARRFVNELEEFKHALDESTIVVVTDLDERITYINQQMVESTGYSREELLGQNPRIFTSGYHPPEFWAEMFRTLKEGKVWRGVVCNRTKSGDLCWLKETVVPLADASGKVSKYMSIRLDITDLLRTQENLESMKLEVVLRLARAGEWRDGDTGMHVARMSKFCRALSRAAGLPKEDNEMIEIAASLHDIGKMGISDAILLKRGPLTSEQRAEMQRHTLIGAEILEGSTVGFLEMARIIALTHHERWDGKGYPDGILGQAIPLFGRICAICDVFDALTTKRPYKQAWSVEDAMAEIRKGAGTQFDPSLVGHFERILPEILEIRAKFDSDELVKTARAA